MSGVVLGMSLFSRARLWGVEVYWRGRGGEKPGRLMVLIWGWLGCGWIEGIDKWDVLEVN